MASHNVKKAVGSGQGYEEARGLVHFSQSISLRLYHAAEMRWSTILLKHDTWILNFIQ
jgi:hypothetical protein